MQVLAWVLALSSQIFRMALRFAASKLYSACGPQRRFFQTAEETWAKHVPKNHIETPAETKKNVQKEASALSLISFLISDGAIFMQMIGFLLLGPIGGGLMIYDFIWGLESHSDNLIPPYPWRVYYRHAHAERTWPFDILMLVGSTSLDSSLFKPTYNIHAGCVFAESPVCLGARTPCLSITDTWHQSGLCPRDIQERSTMAMAIIERGLNPSCRSQQLVITN